MGVQEDSLNELDWEVFAWFGRMMLSAQLLEYSLFELTHLGKKPEERPEVALRRVEGLLKQPAKDQAKGLSALPDELKASLEDVLDGRNKLVHSFLIEYRIKAAIDKDATRWALPLLKEATEDFDRLSRALDAYASKKLAERGLDQPLDEEEIEGVQESLRKWSEEMEPPEEDVDPPEDPHDP